MQRIAAVETVGTRARLGVVTLMSMTLMAAMAAPAAGIPPGQRAQPRRRRSDAQGRQR